MNNQKSNEIINTIKNLSKSRMLFSPKNLISKYKLSIISNDTCIVDLSSITDNAINNIDLLNVLLYDYKGIAISDFKTNINHYTIYYEVSKDSLMGGIYDINANKKLSKVVFIHTNNLEATNDSQYIYSTHSEFFIELCKKFEV